MTPAPWYADALPGLRAPRTAAYNFSAVGHVPFIAEEPPLSADDEARLDRQFNDRWRTLLSVDDLVSDVVAALEETGLAANTFIFYSSECARPSTAVHPARCSPTPSLWHLSIW
jgi:N-acetylglucosamine-6-sulfatase